MRRARRAALITAAVLLTAVAAVLAATTPWNPLPGRVPGGAVRPDPERDFAPAELARSAAFDQAITPPAYAGLLVGLLAVGLLGLTPLGARLLGACTGWTRRRTLRLVTAVIALTTLLRLVALPFAVWRESVLRRYGLSVQTWPSWLLDQLKSLGLTWVIWTVAALALFALARRFPRYWWTGAAVGGFALVVAVSFVYPVVVEPLFNRFTSLPAGRLRTELLQMAERDGVPVEDVLVADASRRTTALNAYVSGFGSTRRIVVYDTLLSSPPERIRSIVAHELGHAKRRDVLHGTLVGALSVSGCVCLLFLVLTSPRLRRRAGLADDGSDGADPRQLALLLAAVTVLTQLGGPVQNLVSRRIEARADAHALNLTRDPATFVSMQRELSIRNLSDLRPDPVEYALWFTHPSGPERIAMARTWARLNGVPEPRGW
ncbi:M48 family metallopeptidase [Thermomonospora catenispora]|uniref:M48 family metallopeptidase n=1 Tax=Thermomonospora catenispora TaxID=2493090 RepID=UPI0011233416|nr:M48 family metallopeptidase [Thermomonospora catenispora]TNY36211.1 M48 family peptidase [Thermomonospora catenispora]